MKTTFMGLNSIIWQPGEHSNHFQKSPNDLNNSVNNN